MNLNEITLNECNNNGSTIYVYYNPIAGVWISYGISAYLLKRYCDSTGIQAIESFSTDMQMPTAIIIDIVDIAKNANVSHSSTTGYILKTDDSANQKEYIAWAADLRKSLK